MIKNIQFGSSDSGATGFPETKIDPDAVGVIMSEIQHPGKLRDIVVTIDGSTYILSEDSELFATGKNRCGQLGLGDNENRNVFTPVPLPDDLEIKKIYAEFESCYLLTSNNQVWVAGCNHKYQLGTKDNKHVSSFQQIEIGVEGEIRDIVLLRNSAYLLIGNKNILVCGENKSGQLGTGNTEIVQQFTPIALPDSISLITQLVAKYSSAYFSADNNQLWATGNNRNGRLGLGDTIDRNVFTRALALSGGKIQHIVPESKSVFVVINNMLFFCGNNMGNIPRRIGDHRKLFRIDGRSFNISKIQAYDSSLYFKSDNHVYISGSNQYGQLGIGSDIPVSAVITDSRFVNFWSAPGYAYVINSDGKLASSGLNTVGQLGCGYLTNRNTFTSVSGLPADYKIAQVYLSNQYAFVVLTSGLIFATGNNKFGQLGMGHYNTLNKFNKTSISFFGYGKEDHSHLLHDFRSALSIYPAYDYMGGDIPQDIPMLTTLRELVLLYHQNKNTFGTRDFRIVGTPGIDAGGVSREFISKMRPIIKNKLLTSLNGGNSDYLENRYEVLSPQISQKEAEFLGAFIAKLLRSNKKLIPGLELHPWILDFLQRKEGRVNDIISMKNLLVQMGHTSEEVLNLFSFKNIRGIYSTLEEINQLINIQNDILIVTDKLFIQDKITELALTTYQLKYFNSKETVPPYDENTYIKLVTQYYERHIAVYSLALCVIVVHYRNNPFLLSITTPEERDQLNQHYQRMANSDYSDIPIYLKTLMTGRQDRINNPEQQILNDDTLKTYLETPGSIASPKMLSEKYLRNNEVTIANIKGISRSKKMQLNRILKRKEMPKLPEKTKAKHADMVETIKFLEAFHKKITTTTKETISNLKSKLTTLNPVQDILVESKGDVEEGESKSPDYNYTFWNGIECKCDLSKLNISCDTLRTTPYYHFSQMIDKYYAMKTGFINVLTNFYTDPQARVLPPLHNLKIWQFNTLILGEKISTLDDFITKLNFQVDHGFHLIDAEGNRRIVSPKEAGDLIMQALRIEVEKSPEDYIPNLIKYTTGSEYLVIGDKIQLGPKGSDKCLAAAHTCFNQLDLPRVISPENLAFALNYENIKMGLASGMTFAGGNPLRRDNNSGRFKIKYH